MNNKIEILPHDFGEEHTRQRDWIEQVLLPELEIEATRLLATRDTVKILKAAEYIKMKNFILSHRDEWKGW